MSTADDVTNWNVCPKMKTGLVEDAKSYKNNISNNSLNFFAEEAVLSKGTDTVIDKIVGRADVPDTNIVRKDKKDMDHHFKATIIQTYQTELTDEYIGRND